MEKNEGAVLFLINKFKTGGAERVFIYSANELYRRGHRVYVGTLFPETKLDTCLSDLEVPPDHIVHLSATSLFDIGFYRTLSNFIRKKKIGVVYSTLEYANIVTRIIGIFRPSLRVCIREANVASAKPFLHKGIDALLNFRTDVIVAVSESTRASLVRYQPFYKRKIRVLRNAVEIPSEKTACALRSNDTPTILSVGSLTPQKRHDILLRAFALVRKKIPSIRLVIVGGGKDHPALEQLAEELEISDAVTFTGVLPHTDVLKWYQRSDVFALTSEWEGNPNVIKEAMAHCLPVVTTDLPSTQGIVEDGKNGYLVSARDVDSLHEKILTLVRSKPLREGLGHRGYVLARNRYDTNTYTEALIKILYGN